MNIRSLAVLSSVALTSIACSGGGSNTTAPPDGGGSSGGGSGSSGGSSSGSSAGSSSGNGGGSSSGSSGGSSSGSNGGSSSGSSGGSSSGSSGGSSSGSSSGGPPFAAGTICNSSGKALTPPATLKNIIVIMMENENFSSVNGNASAPYISSLATKCGTATAYDDNCFTDNLLSCPHYLALTSGSNCDTGLDSTGGGPGTGCISTDDDPTPSTLLTTTSIFSQVSSWKAYEEDMASACDATSSGNYAAKHNPPAYYSSLSTCATNDVTIAAVGCANAPNTPCTPAPSNAFTDDLANDTLAQFTFVTPNLINDMHGIIVAAVAPGDNWLATYMPLIFASKAYLRGDVAVQIIWDEQDSSTFGGPIPNVFVSPYITAGTTSSTPMNHFSLLRAWEKALGITTFLGCAGGTPPGGIGTCPSGSTADVRAALGW
jgi:hypothetical protein